MKKKNKFLQKKYLSFYLMLLVPVLLTFIYHYIPMFGIVIAFLDYNPALGFSRSEFVGWENFINLFTNPMFPRAIRNTIIIACWKILFGLIVPVVFALLLNEVRNSAFKRIAQTVVYLPHFISWVLAAGIVIDVLSPSGGSLNQLLGAFGIEPVFFLGENKWIRTVLIVSDIWKGFGWGTIIYMAALTGIDMNLYEAAAIDGAGKWKQTLYITLPGIQSTIILKMILSLGDVLNAGFDQVYNLVTPITMTNGDIIDTLVFRLGLEQAQFGLSTATGLFKALIGAFFIVTSHRLAYKITGYKTF